jgi:O-acetyl-ADP-ribose deacetylase (regulator of RNase III)
LAGERGARTISFPAISTGAYGYPAKEAADIALASVAQHFEQTESGVREVLFVLFDQGFYDLHARAASRRFHVDRLERHA